MNQSLSSLLTDSQLSSPPNSIPEDFICPLLNHALIGLQGEQSSQYLQGQLTADMEQLKQQPFLRTAHCDPKGKMWSIGLVFTLADNYLISGSQDEMAASLIQLQKYGVFSKTQITDANDRYVSFGIGNKDIQGWLQQQNFADDYHIAKTMEVEGLPCHLLTLTINDAKTLICAHQDRLVDPQLWQRLSILAGICHLDQHSIGQYVPQMLNLQCLDAISFDKGCYAGQEMVARMKYLGKNKRAAYLITGNATTAPQSGDEIQLAVESNWRRGGTIINIAGNAESFYALVVMANDIEQQNPLRIKDDEQSSLTIMQLPYSLNIEE